MVTNDEALAARIRRLRNGGQANRYEHVEFGVNSRLDEIQAAVLRARLTLLPQWTATRRRLAARYRAELAHSTVDVPPEVDPGHVYHLLVVLAGGSERRVRLRRHLDACGIETLVHYPTAIPAQSAVARCHPADCPVAARVCSQVVSLPLHPGLDEASVALVADAVRRFS